MTRTLLEMLMTALIGSVIVINGPALRSEDIIASAQSAANGANIHQLATALEVYDAGYIRNKPLNPEAFKYELKSGGQDYNLSVDE